PLEVAAYGYRELCPTIVRIRGQAGDRDNLARHLDDECHLPVVVDLSEPCQEALGQAAQRAEEPQPDILRRQSLEQLNQRRRVFRPHRPEKRRADARNRLRTLELLRISGDNKPIPPTPR